MPKFARILKFPQQSASPSGLTADEIQDLLNAFVEKRDGDLSQISAHVGDADFVQALLQRLGKVINSTPERVAEISVEVYERLKVETSVGFFDERDFFLGESALLAGNSTRLLGRLDEAEGWLELAELSFRHTVNSSPSLARVSHARLILKYDMRRFSYVLGLLPAVIADYERLGMDVDARKARYLQAVALKESGQADESLQCFLQLSSAFGREEAGLQALVLTAIGEEYGRRGDSEGSLASYQAACSIAEENGDRMASAQLRASLGEAHRAEGNYGAASDCFRAAIVGFNSLAMSLRVASLRIVLAETLLAAGRDREAEWEIIAALPVIESQEMMAEGVAAVALLRESVSRRKTDPEALRKVQHQITRL